MELSLCRCGVNVICRLPHIDIVKKIIFFKKKGGEMVTRKTVTIGVGNQKGGVGKTTMTVQIAAALAEKGRKVLIIDLDVNAGSTKHLGIDPNAYLGTFEVLTGDEEEPLAVVVTSEDEDNNLPENLHIITGSRKLEELEDRLKKKKSKFDDSPLSNVLKPVLRRLQGYYDYIFLDTPPSAPLPIIAAYKAANGFLLVAIPEGLAIEGLGEALDDIRQVREHGNPNLQLIGLAIGAVDNRTRLSRELISYVNEEFNEFFLKPTIPRATIIPTVQTGKKKTIFQAEPTHSITQKFREMADDFEEKVERFLGVKIRPEPEIQNTSKGESVNG
ncbi:MAG: ParA family protein [Symploca sp. SIO1C4]|uniref:ParA family protein n=1 Tax=Symploca sp. SIO1C4 TaxID=2607765 RepID=A0A6B3NB83_9CYAN|nr:ParA family protein [Symploca sp. SIO1C4]